MASASKLGHTLETKERARCSAPNAFCSIRSERARRACPLRVERCNDALPFSKHSSCQFLQLRNPQSSERRIGDARASPSAPRSTAIEKSRDLKIASSAMTFEWQKFPRSPNLTERWCLPYDQPPIPDHLKISAGGHRDPGSDRGRHARLRLAISPGQSQPTKKAPPAHNASGASVGEEMPQGGQRRQPELPHRRRTNFFSALAPVLWIVDQICPHCSGPQSQKDKPQPLVRVAGHRRGQCTGPLRSADPRRLEK
jgi:hypothetical protein